MYQEIRSSHIKDSIITLTIAGFLYKRRVVETVLRYPTICSKQNSSMICYGRPQTRKARVKRLDFLGIFAFFSGVPNNLVGMIEAA